MERSSLPLLFHIPGALCLPGRAQRQRRTVMNIQWYPGHMTKTRRQIETDLKLVDAVVEIMTVLNEKIAELLR